MTKAEQIAWYKTFDTFRKSRVKSWAPKVYRALLNIIKSATGESSVQSAIRNLDRNIQYTELAGIIQSIYVDAGRVMGGKAYQLVKKQAVKAMMPIGYNEELINEIIAYLKLHNLQMVTAITDNMKEWILEKLIEGQQQAKSITQIADDMLKDGFPKKRAIVIARTETIKSANYGAMQGARKAGYKTQKIWIAAKDFRTRSIPRDAYSHTAMDGITIDIDELFKVPKRTGGYDDIMQPGAPDGDAGNVIQCRCTIGFKVLRGENGLPVRV